MVAYLNRLLDPIRNQFRSQEMQQLRARAYPKVEKLADNPGKLELRVGDVMKVAAHPDPKMDYIYMSEVAIGESDVRTVALPVANRCSAESLSGQKLMIWANVNCKKVKYGKVKVTAVALGAWKDAMTCELVPVPADAPTGSAITFEGYEDEAKVQLNEKAAGRIFSNLLVGQEDSLVSWNGLQATTEAGPCTVVDSFEGCKVLDGRFVRFK